jgi:hypothetical protein
MTCVIVTHEMGFANRSVTVCCSLTAVLLRKKEHRKKSSTIRRMNGQKSSCHRSSRKEEDMKTTFQYDHYLLYEEMKKDLEYFASTYPQLCKLEVNCVTAEGRNQYAVTLTNHQDGGCIIKAGMVSGWKHSCR